MVAITSLASWLLLTPNQLFCFLAMFIAIAGQIVCFETAKSNSPMCKKEHLIGSQCSLCWFELRANEDRWVGERACVCRCSCCVFTIHQSRSRATLCLFRYHSPRLHTAAIKLPSKLHNWVTAQARRQSQLTAIFTSTVLIAWLIRKSTFPRSLQAVCSVKGAFIDNYWRIYSCKGG